MESITPLTQRYEAMTNDINDDFEAGQFQDLLDLDAGKPDAAALAQWSADDVFSPWQENGELVVGTPEEDAEFHVHQKTDFHVCRRFSADDS